MLLSEKLKSFLFISVSLNSVIALLDTDFHCLPTMQQRQQHCPVSGGVVVCYAQFVALAFNYSLCIINLLSYGACNRCVTLSSCILEIVHSSIGMMVLLLLFTLAITKDMHTLPSLFFYTTSLVTCIFTGTTLSCGEIT